MSHLVLDDSFPRSFDPSVNIGVQSAEPSSWIFFNSAYGLSMPGLD